MKNEEEGRLNILKKKYNYFEGGEKHEKGSKCKSSVREGCTIEEKSSFTLDLKDYQI